MKVWPTRIVQEVQWAGPRPVLLVKTLSAFAVCGWESFPVTHCLKPGKWHTSDPQVTLKWPTSLVTQTDWPIIGTSHHINVCCLCHSQWPTVWSLARADKEIWKTCQSYLCICVCVSVIVYLYLYICVCEFVFWRADKEIWKTRQSYLSVTAQGWC